MRFPAGPHPSASTGGSTARLSLRFLIGLCVLSGTFLLAQTPKPATANAEQELQQHYDAARTFQISGDNDRAAAEYRAFLGAALNRAGNARFASGDMEAATTLYDSGLLIVPGDSDIRLSYAALKLAQDKVDDSEKLASEVLQASPKNVQALVLLGRIAYRKGEYQKARENLEAAVVEKSSFDVGYLLGLTYIKLGDYKRVRLLFDDMLTGIGDTAQIHIYFGRAYAEGETEQLDNAILEFKKAIAKDPKILQAHYFMALAYLNRDGQAGFTPAATELRAELALNPEDSRSHYLLGYIAMKQHQPAEAEKELQQASKLDPDNPDPFLYLGQLYSESNRDAEAEAALRKAIALTKDVSRGDYQINRAHYVLGRVLLKNNQKEEGEKELAISKELRDHIRNPEAMKQELTGLTGATPTAPMEIPTSPEARREADAMVNQLKPAIADAYNNLGVISAGKKEFTVAMNYFKSAQEWEPSLQTVDRNLGMAAFYANDFKQAVEPLSRHLQQHSDDVRARAALGLSYFMTQEFSDVLETLKPVEQQVDGDPGLAYAYAVSLVKTGNYNEGVRRLKALDSSKSNSPELHALLGQAYADQNEYGAAMEEYRKSLALDPNQPQTNYLLGLVLLRNGNPAEAVESFRAALKANPQDSAKKYHLAFALIQIQQKDEARELLKQVIGEDPKYADAYYELGKLQLEQGDTKAAIASFENGSRLSPESDYMHYQLAMAYRRDSRIEDAEREIKLYQALKNQHRGRDVPQSN